MPEKPKTPLDQLRIDIYIDFREDFERLRQLLNKAEELKDLVSDWNQIEARQIFDDMLDIGDKCVRARRDREADNERSPQNRPPKDVQ